MAKPQPTGNVDAPNAYALAEKVGHARTAAMHGSMKADDEAAYPAQRRLGRVSTIALILSVTRGKGMPGLDDWSLPGVSVCQLGMLRHGLASCSA